MDDELAEFVHLVSGAGSHGVGWNAEGRPRFERLAGGFGTVHGQSCTIGLVEPSGVGTERRRGRAHVLAACPKAFVVGVDEEIEGFLDLLSNSRGPAVAVVQIEREVTQSDGLDPSGDDVERGTLLSDEQHPASLCDRPTQKIGDGLRLSCSGRTFEHEGPPAHGVGDRGHLGTVSGDGARRRECFEVVPHVGRHRVTEFLGRCVGQMVGQRRGEQRLPVLRQVLPQPELRELQQSQTRSGLHPKRVPAADEGFADSTDDLVERDALVVAGRVGQSGERQSERQPELLQEAVVGFAGARLVKNQVVAARASAARLEMDGHENERRAQLPALKIPHQCAERDVEVVRPGLLFNGAGLVGQASQALDEHLVGQVGEHRCLRGQRFAQHSLGQVGGPLDAVAVPIDVVVGVTGRQLHLSAAVHQVFQIAQACGRYVKADGATIREVDQTVPQTQIQQRVLPALHTRGNGLPLGSHGPGGLPLRSGSLGGCHAVVSRLIEDGLPGARLETGHGGKGEDLAAPRGPDVEDADDRPRFLPHPKLRGRPRVRECDLVVALSGQRRLDQPDVAQFEPVDHLGHIGVHRRPAVDLVAPPTDEGVASEHPHERSDAGLLERRSEQQRGVEAGAELRFVQITWCSDLLPLIRPTGRRFAVADAPVDDCRVDGGRQLIDPVGARLVAVDLALRGDRAGVLGGSAQQEGDLGRVGHDVGGEQFERQALWPPQPLPRRENSDGAGGGADHLAVMHRPKLHGARPGLLHLIHGGRVEVERQVTERRRAPRFEVGVSDEGLREHTLTVAQGHMHLDARPQNIVVVEGDSLNGRDAVVGHGVAHNRIGLNLDVKFWSHPWPFSAVRRPHCGVDVSLAHHAVRQGQFSCGCEGGHPAATPSRNVTYVIAPPSTCIRCPWSEARSGSGTCRGGTVWRAGAGVELGAGQSPFGEGDQIEHVLCAIEALALAAADLKDPRGREVIQGAISSHVGDIVNALHRGAGENGRGGQILQDERCCRVTAEAAALAALSARSEKSVVPLGAQVPQFTREVLGLLAGRDDRAHERGQPLGPRDMEGVAADGVRMSVSSQASHVVVAQGGEHHADRQHCCGRQATPSQNRMDERAPHASVAVSERVDGLKLGMRQAGLDDGRVATAVHVGDQIRHQRVNVARVGRDEVGVERMMVRAADPVLDAPKSVVLGFLGQERGMELLDVVDRDGGGFNERRTCLVNHGHVVGNPLSLLGHGRHWFGSP